MGGLEDESFGCVISDDVGMVLSNAPSIFRTAFDVWSDAHDHCAIASNCADMVLHPESGRCLSHLCLRPSPCYLAPPHKPKRPWGDVRERGLISCCSFFVTRSHVCVSFQLLWSNRRTYGYYGNCRVQAKEHGLRTLRVQEMAVAGLWRGLAFKPCLLIPPARSHLTSQATVRACIRTISAPLSLGCARCRTNI